MINFLFAGVRKIHCITHIKATTIRKLYGLFVRTRKVSNKQCSAPAVHSAAVLGRTLNGMRRGRGRHFFRRI